VNENIRIKEKKAHKMFKKRVLFKEIAYNNNEAKKYYQEMNSIRK
jgi:hypothetical protein